MNVVRFKPSRLAAAVLVAVGAFQRLDHHLALEALDAPVDVDTIAWQRELVQMSVLRV